jgi:hypothetical protein
MFKKLCIVAIATITVSTQAKPIYLTFEGTINESISISTITAPNMGAANIVLKADLDAGGYYDDLQAGDYFYNYYLLDYVSSPIFTGGLGNPFGDPDGDIFQLGVYVSSIYGNDNWIIVSPTDQRSFTSAIHLNTVSYAVEPFEVGATYVGIGYAIDNYLKGGASWRGEFTLTDVTPQSVPEPNTFVLVGFGLIGLAGGCKRWKKKA